MTTDRLERVAELAEVHVDTARWLLLDTNWAAQVPSMTEAEYQAWLDRATDAELAAWIQGMARVTTATVSRR